MFEEVRITLIGVFESLELCQLGCGDFEVFHGVFEFVKSLVFDIKEILVERLMLKAGLNGVEGFPLVLNFRIKRLQFHTLVFTKSRF